MTSIRNGVQRFIQRAINVIRAANMAFRNFIVNLLRPFFRFIGQLRNIRFARPFQKLKPMDRFLRFFKAQTRNHPKVGEGWFGRILKKAFPKMKWQQHHVTIPQRWFRPGSSFQWYPNDALANAGLRALGNAGWNLIALPAFLHTIIHSWSLSGVVGVLTYTIIFLGIRHIYTKIKNGSDEEFDNRRLIIIN